MAFILIPIMTVVAYLLGSLSAAIIVSRYFGMDDPRTYGSGNPGASNMLRSGNKKAAAFTLIGDALKGLIAVLLARCLQSMFDLGDGIVGMAAMAVVVGHMYPLFFHFKGGKGVATALGVILGMSFWVSFWVVAIWLLIAYKFKKSSVAALVAASCAPFISFIIQGHHPKLSWSLFAISLLILYRHKDNIQRLKSGNELGIGEPAKPLFAQGQPENQIADDNEVLDQTIAEEIAQAEELVEETEQKAKETVKVVIEKTKETVEVAVETAKENVEQVIEKTKETVEQVSEKTKESVEQATDKVKETTQKVKETAKDVANEAVENVKTDIDQAIKKHDTEQAQPQTVEAETEETVETAKTELRIETTPTKSTRGRRKKTDKSEK